jgi:uracil-DNA glycosylase family 4
MADVADTERLGRLAKQHAETSALLGVDFVPSYRVSNSGAAAGVIESKPEPAADAEPGDRDDLDNLRAEDPSATAGAVGAPAAVDPGAGSVVASGSKAEALDALREKYIADEPHAAFETAHTSIVFGEGDPDARLMFVGEAPGADEDRLGRPFVGKSGQLLEKMIVAMGLSREAVYIANVLKTRPPGNRTPTVEEARACAPYLYEQIRIISPEVIVTLGKSAGQLLLGNSSSMGAMRGKWAAFPPQTPLVPVDAAFPEIAVMPTYHPAYLLRSYTAENRAAVWSDLQLVMERLGMAG